METYSREQMINHCVWAEEDTLPDPLDVSLEEKEAFLQDLLAYYHSLSDLELGYTHTLNHPEYNQKEQAAPRIAENRRRIEAGERPLYAGHSYFGAQPPKGADEHV